MTCPCHRRPNSFGLDRLQPPGRGTEIDHGDSAMGLEMILVRSISITYAARELTSPWSGAHRSVELAFHQIFYDG